MSPSFVIARNTFKELVRDKILLVVLFLSVFLVFFSSVLANLSFDEQTKITLDLSLAGTQLTVSLLAMFVGSFLLSREIEKRTILTILVRPLERHHFLIGKFVGLCMALAVILLAFFVVLSGFLLLHHLSLWLPLIYIFIGIFLECTLLVAMSIFWSTVTKPLLAAFMSLSIFLLGHWLEDLRFFSQKSTAAFKLFSEIIQRILPDLEKTNWRSLILEGQVILPSQVALVTLFIVCWVAFFLTFSTIVFRRKDIV